MTDIFTFRLKEMASAIDARFKRVETLGLPTGGSPGQILSKTGPGSLDVAWTPPPAVPPPSGPIITVGPIPPPSPAVNQLWVDTN